MHALKIYLEKLRKKGDFARLIKSFEPYKVVQMSAQIKIYL